MFLLSETELIGGIPLKSISRIDISFYKSRNESLNIFNLELDFDENIIPLITSILECQPVLIRRKTYIGLDTDYIIERKMDIDIDCNSNLNFILGKGAFSASDYFALPMAGLDKGASSVPDYYALHMAGLGKGGYPSFQVDIDKFNKNTSIHKSYWQSQKLHYSQVYPKSQELVRIYSRDDSDLNRNSCRTYDSKSNNQIFNPQDALGSKEEIVIYWVVSGMSKFELCLASNPISTSSSASDNNDTRKKCIWRLVVNVIEDNHFIDSKVDAVNTWLEKIHKIKSTIKIANQETNTEEI